VTALQTFILLYISMSQTTEAIERQAIIQLQSRVTTRKHNLLQGKED